MAAVGSKIPVICLLLVSFFITLIFRPIGVNDIFFWGARLLLVLAFVTLAISLLTPYLSSFFLASYTQTVPQDEMDRQQEIVRKDQQEYLNKKVKKYSEDILKPREAEKRKKQDQTFYRKTRQNWRLTAGHRLGQETEDSDCKEDSEDFEEETANKKAIRKRKLPEQVTRPVLKAQQPQSKKVIITLPEEPGELEVGVITIALRCPSGRVYKRRFYKSCSSLVLLDWMMKIGYHSALYTICTPLPKCYLELGKDLTLEDIGITKRTVLNVEERDVF